MIAVVVVNLAGSNASRSPQHAKEEQAYFTATAALNLVQDSFTSPTKGCYLDMKTSTDTVASAFGYGQFSAGSEIGAWASNWTTVIFQDYVSGTINSYDENLSKKSFTIHADSSLMSDDDVTVELSMGKDYKISAAITNADQDYNYNLQVEIPVSEDQASINVDGNGKPTYPYVVSWGAVVDKTPVATKGRRTISLRQRVWHRITD